MMFCQDALFVTDTSQIGEVRRHAHRVAERAGLDATECGKVAIIATEMATNLARYATGGEMLVRSFFIGRSSGVEFLAIDRGPGMSNVARCMEDGYSSGGTPGNGLGAVERLATVFDIYSTQPGGTIVLARVQMGSSNHQGPGRFDWGVINRPVPPGPISGDVWRIAERDGECALMIADGLGHGPLAADAANAAATVFDGDGFMAPQEFLTAADRKMRGTRGAAVAVARINGHSESLAFAGVGNIAGTLRMPQSARGRGLLSHNGTVGVQMRRVQTFDIECPGGSLLIMHSDGLQSRWALESYSGLTERHPAIIAGVLYRDFCRGKDDVTVAVIRCANRGPRP